MNLRLLLAVLLATAALAQDKPRVILLRDGSTIFGVVQRSECTEEAVVIRDRRSGGKRTIRWDQLNADTAKKLRVALGFETEDAVTELNLQGHELKNRAGRVFVGLVLNVETAKKDGYYHLKTAERDLKIPFADVAEPPEDVELDALVVYTPVELYEKKLAAEAPTDAVGHFRLAEFSRKIGALAEAKLHYEKVLSFGESQYRPQTIQRQIARVEKLLGMKEATDALRAIKSAIVFKRFIEAHNLLDAFNTKHEGDEELLKAASELAEEAKQREEENNIAQVSRLMLKTVKDRLARRLKEEQELTLAEARRYASGDATDETSLSAHALAKVGAKLNLEPKAVLAAWEKRSKRSTRLAFYRDGSFIVIPDLGDPLSRAPKGDAPKGKKGAKINLPKPRPALTPDQWWDQKRAAKKNRDLRDFLYAWWAEHSGMCETIEPKDETCPTCAGKGFVLHVVMTPAGAQQYADRCTTCHGALRFRVVRFK